MRGALVWFSFSFGTGPHKCLELQESLERARRDLSVAKERAAPLERERAAAVEEARHLEDRRTQAQQTVEELRKQVIFFTIFALD